MAKSWAWRVHLGFVRTSPAEGASVIKGDELNRSLRRRLWHQPLLRQQPGRMVPALPTSLPSLHSVRVPKKGPAILRPTRAQCRHCRIRRLISGIARDIPVSSFFERVIPCYPHLCMLKIANTWILNAQIARAVIWISSRKL